MAFFSPAQSSDIVAVLQEIINIKTKIKLGQEDIKEAIKGLVEQHKDELTKEEVNDWIKWMMAPEKKDGDFSKLEESQAKFESIMQMRNQFKQVDAPLDLNDLD